jgi:glutamine synthetase
MGTLRFKALEEVLSRKPVEVKLPSTKTSDYFGKNVFDIKTMRAYLSEEAYNGVLESINLGTKINRKIANQIAAGMRAWAADGGATHYTHWFQPLTGATAEKHDAFFEPSEQGGVIEKFDGEMLVQQEPDASSFPSGGLRNTFEARGYTAWDPTSPAFIIGSSLCIPTIFVSYMGEALDYKMPLIKSLSVLDKAASEICRFFDKDVSKVIATLGWEQEYFLIDQSLFYARPDIMLTGRTLMGHASAKDQQLDDHYFGSIPDRAAAFMRDLEVEALKLSIPIKTKHNEVAPNQFECAPVFEEANLAVDHNVLLMDLMEKIARRHSFRVLLHEKPYRGINGSGKHNNWSLMTNTGVNLLSPGKTPKKNLQFLTFLVNTVKAVHDHADLLRSSIVSHGNEHRLGAHEAPPAIVSIFLGTQLTKMLDEIEDRVSVQMTPAEKAELKIDIGKIPEILLDNTDRNRTSPFAFTGNRFEFRAVGSSANPASPMIALNTAVANQLIHFKTEVDTLIKKGVKRDEAILQTLRQYIIDSKRIRFEGNGYGEEWVKEAEARGLTNISDVPTALQSFISDSSREIFVNNNIFTNRELEARLEIRLENYTKSLQIESRVLGDLAINHIIPTALKYQTVLINNVRGIKDLFGSEDYDEMATPHLQSIKKISRHSSFIRKLVVEMVEIRKKINELKTEKEIAEGYSHKIKPYLDDIRYHIDKLELIVDDEIWPLPKYRELLFTR